jgi:hypothetical protein
MSVHAVTLDEKHYRAVEDKARALGQTPEEYLQSLIDADSRTFDEILEPARRGFDKMSDAEVDGIMNRARKSARSRAK